MILSNIEFIWSLTSWLILISLSCAITLFAGFTPFFFMPMIFSNVVFLWLRRWWFIIKYIGHNNRKEYFHCFHLSLIDLRNHNFFTLATIWSVYTNVILERIIFALKFECNLKCSSYCSPLILLAIFTLEL